MTDTQYAVQVRERLHGWSPNGSFEGPSVERVFRSFDNANRAALGGLSHGTRIVVMDRKPRKGEILEGPLLSLDSFYSTYEEE